MHLLNHRGKDLWNSPFYRFMIVSTRPRAVGEPSEGMWRYVSAPSFSAGDRDVGKRRRVSAEEVYSCRSTVQISTPTVTSLPFGTTRCSSVISMCKTPMPVLTIGYPFGPEGQGQCPESNHLRTTVKETAVATRARAGPTYFSGMASEMVGNRGVQVCFSRSVGGFDGVFPQSERVWGTSRAGASVSSSVGRSEAEFSNPRIHSNVPFIYEEV